MPHIAHIHPPQINTHTYIHNSNIESTTNSAKISMQIQNMIPNRNFESRVHRYFFFSNRIKWLQHASLQSITFGYFVRFLFSIQVNGYLMYSCCSNFPVLCVNKWFIFGQNVCQFECYFIFASALAHFEWKFTPMPRTNPAERCKRKERYILVYYILVYIFYASLYSRPIYFADAALNRQKQSIESLIFFNQLQEIDWWVNDIDDRAKTILFMARKYQSLSDPCYLQSGYGYIQWKYRVAKK